MTLRSMQNSEEHECDDERSPDVDICADCREHASFCSICETSGCCGAWAYFLD